MIHFKHSLLIELKKARTRLEISIYIYKTETLR